MTKKASKIDAALALVSACGFRHARANAETVAAIKAAGGDQPTVRMAFMAGWIAGCLNATGAMTTAMADKARDVLVKKGTLRTPAETAAYNAAKAQWSRLMKKAGVKTTETRGGKKTSAPRVTKANETKATVEAAPVETKAAPVARKATTPRIKTRDAATTWIAAWEAQGLAFINKNADHTDATLAKLIRSINTRLSEMKTEQ
jgi:hypothetical protein